jgi:hypothetical protein
MTATWGMNVEKKIFADKGVLNQFVTPPVTATMINFHQFVARMV